MRGKTSTYIFCVVQKSLRQKFCFSTVLNMASIRVPQAVVFFLAIANISVGNKVSRLETRLRLLEDRMSLDTMEFREDFKRLFSIVNDTFTAVSLDASDMEPNFQADETKDHGSVTDYIAALKRGFAQEKRLLKEYIQSLELKVKEMQSETEKKIKQFSFTITEAVNEINESCAVQALNMKSTYSEFATDITEDIKLVNGSCAGQTTTLAREFQEFVSGIDDDINRINGSTMRQAMKLDPLSVRLHDLENNGSELQKTLKRLENTVDMTKDQSLVNEANTATLIERLAEVVKGQKKLQETVDKTADKVGNLYSTVLAKLTMEDKWREYAGSYYYFGNGIVHWSEAANTCESLGAYLAEVDSREENDFLVTLVESPLNTNNIHVMWLGGTDIDKEGDWVWTHSKRKVTYTNWGRGEPNGKRRENCLHTYRGNGEWNDIGCGHKCGFICEADGI